MHKFSPQQNRTGPEGELNFVVARARKEKKREKREKKGGQMRKKNIKRKKGEMEGPWARAGMGSRRSRRAQWNSQCALRTVACACALARRSTPLLIRINVHSSSQHQFIFVFVGLCFGRRLPSLYRKLERSPQTCSRTSASSSVRIVFLGMVQ